MGAKELRFEVTSSPYRHMTHWFVIDSKRHPCVWRYGTAHDTTFTKECNEFKEGVYKTRQEASKVAHEAKRAARNEENET